MVSYIQYAKAHNVITYKPNINISTNRFEVNQVGMFMPLQTIHSIGEMTTLDIVSERNKNGLYKNFEDFKERTKLSESALEALIYAGALDSFGMTKKQMIEAKDSINEIFSRHLEGKIEDTSEYEFKYLQEKEQVYLGFNLTYDIFLNLPQLQTKLQANYLSKKTGRCVGCFDVIKEIITKKKELMLVGEFSDSQTTLSYVIFPLEYQRLSIKLESGRLYCIEYTNRIDEKTKQNQLVIKNVIEC